MTNVLLLAYYFPPVGGAGAQRNTKLARYLPELGYRVTVITGPGPDDRRWTPLDPTMAAEIPAGVRVARLHGVEPEPAGARRLERWLRLRSDWERWWGDGVRAAVAELGEEYDVVYASLAPFQSARGAIDVARRLERPLILDLEDPWALDEMMVYETALHAAMERRLMRKTLLAADGIVMNTPEAALRVRQAFPELGSSPITSVLNGFDGADFVGSDSTVESGRPFRIVHTGSLHTAAARRRGWRKLLGGAGEVDIRTRSLIYLLEALDDVVAREAPGSVELVLAGNLTEADRSVIANRSYVRERGFLSHAETIALMRGADLLFLPMHDVPQGRRVAIIPCKTYEYLASGRPMLAAVPDGDARDLLRAAGSVRLSRPTDVEAMRVAIDQAIAERRSGRELVAPAPEVVAQLERHSLTRQLADFIEVIVPLSDRLETSTA